MKRTCKRKKAFLGAIIGAVTGIAGSAISAASQRKAQEKQIKRENYINRNQSANNLSAAYSNEEYVDDFLNKTAFKYGGNKTMAELPKTKLVRKLYVNPKYITKNTAKIPAQKLPKTKLALKRNANVASNTTRNTTQESTKKPVQTSNANTNRNTVSTAIKNEVKNAGRYIMAGALDLAGGYAHGPRNLARTYVKDIADIMVGGYKHFTKTSAKKPTQKPTQTAKAVTKKNTNKTYTTSKNFGKRVSRAIINTGIDLAGGPTVFPQRTAERIARTYLNYMTNLIVNGRGKNPVKNTTQKTKPTSPVAQTRTAVKRNTNTTSTATRNNANATKGNTRQTTTTRTNTPAKASTTTNRPAQRTTQRPANTSTQRPVKPTTQKTTKPSNANTTTNKATTTKTTTQPTRQNSDNKLTFSRAFASARRAGKQTFNWNGKSYTTQLAGEKKNNTSEKTYKAPAININEVDSVKALKRTNTIPSSSSVIPKSNTLNIADNNGYYDRLKMMKCGGKRKMKCGGKCK